MRNPTSENGGKPWAVAEQQQMVRQAKAYSLFFSRVVYHTNSVDLAAHYTRIFRESGIQNFRFVITPAIQMSKNMPKSYMERILGMEFERERRIAGTRPGEEASVRYVSFDDPTSIPELFHEVLNKPEPYLLDGGQFSKARNWSFRMAAIFLRYRLATISEDGASKSNSAQKRSAAPPRKW